MARSRSRSRSRDRDRERDRDRDGELGALGGSRHWGRRRAGCVEIVRENVTMHAESSESSTQEWRSVKEVVGRYYFLCRCARRASHLCSVCALILHRFCMQNQQNPRSRCLCREWMSQALRCLYVREGRTRHCVQACILTHVCIHACMHTFSRTGGRDRDRDRDRSRKVRNECP